LFYSRNVKKNFSKKTYLSSGFTIIEIIIIMVIVSTLVVIVLSALNPLEQINRGRDSSSLLLASEFIKTTDRFQAINQPHPWQEDLSAEPLSSDLSKEIIEKFISANELKNSYINQNTQKLEKIFITTHNGYEEIFACFLPESHAFYSHDFTKYNQYGEVIEDCSLNRCYLCLSNKSEENEQDTPVPTPTSTNNDSYPPYPWTCVSSDKYENFGCNNFCTRDMGCNSACADGERQLVKSYGSSGPTHTDCTNHHLETLEYYCVKDPDARCDLTNGGTSWVDNFYWNWTLSAPIRWRETDEPIPVWKPWAL